MIGIIKEIYVIIGLLVLSVISIGPPSYNGPVSRMLDFGLDLRKTKKIVAIGDLHGDYQALVKVLEYTNSSQASILITTGDTIDRGDYTIEMLSFFMKNDRFIHLLGNHELMNLNADLRYVSKGDFLSFGGKNQRIKAFSEGNEYWKYLWSRNITYKIGDIVFAHGGISLKIATKYKTIQNINQNFKASSDLQGSYGPLWYRDYASKPESEICDDLYRTLDILQANFMVMGHTIFKEITTRCRGKAIFIDTGISYTIDSNPSALEITQIEEYTTQIKAYYPDRQEILFRVE
jgi:predicted phosphodiesterase